MIFEFWSLISWPCLSVLAAFLGSFLRILWIKTVLLLPFWSVCLLFFSLTQYITSARASSTICWIETMRADVLVLLSVSREKHCLPPLYMIKLKVYHRVTQLDHVMYIPFYFSYFSVLRVLFFLHELVFTFVSAFFCV